MEQQTEKILFLGIILFLWTSYLSAQAPDTLWTKTYGGVSFDVGHSIQKTSNGGYIITGSTSSFGLGYDDVYLIKTDADGETLWTKTYGGINHDGGYSVQETSDSGFIITGWTDSFGAGYSDVYLIKTDADGDSIWTKTYGGIYDDIGYSIQETSDGGYIITGETDTTGVGWFDVYLIKTDSDGDSIWTKTYGGIYDDIGYSVQETSDSGYIVAGKTGSFGAGWWDVYLIKTDADGDSIWTKTYGGIYDDIGYSIQETSDGGFIIAGWTSSFGPVYDYVYLIRTDSIGDSLWVKTYGGTGGGCGRSVQQTPDGGYIITGYSYSHCRVYLVRTDSTGDMLWQSTYWKIETNEGHSVQMTSDGGYIIAGFKTVGPFNTDVYVIKTEPDPFIVKENQGTNPIIRTPLLEISPNPFSNRIKIDFKLPQKARIRVSIYDISGRLVKELYRGVCQNLSFYWDGRDRENRNVKTGIYFLSIKDFESGETIRTKLLKIE